MSIHSTHMLYVKHPPVQITDKHWDSGRNHTNQAGILPHKILHQDTTFTQQSPSSEEAHTVITVIIRGALLIRGPGNSGTQTKDQLSKQSTMKPTLKWQLSCPLYAVRQGFVCKKNQPPIYVNKYFLHNCNEFPIVSSADSITNLSIKN